MAAALAARGLPVDSTELLAVFRDEVSDTERPYVWSDEAVYSYIDEAQKMFCRNTYGIEDARGFTVDIQTGVEWYEMSPAILKVRSATLSSNGNPIRVIASEQLRVNQIKFDGRVDLVSVLVTGLEKNMMRAWPVPSMPVTIELLTFRLPVRLAIGAEPEIDEQHHRGLLLWAKHRAYDVQGSDTTNRTSSERYFTQWTEYCAKARSEQGRRVRPTGVVSYGGI